MDLEDFLKTVQGRKIQKQIKAAHEHKRQFLKYAGEFVDLAPGTYLTTDDAGKIVERRKGGEDNHEG